MNARASLAAVASALLVMACSGGGTSSADLVGTWNLTKYELVSSSHPATKVDLIARGASGTVVLRADGTYRMTLRTPGQADEDDVGTWSASSDVLTTTQPGTSGNMQFEYVLSGSTLTLQGADSDWDFDGDGVSEPAKLDITAVKG